MTIKPAFLLTLIISITAVSFGLNQNNTDSKAGVFALEYVRALDAFHLLKAMDRDYAGAVDAIEARTNILRIDPESAHYEDIQGILNEIDSKPKSIQYKAEIKEVRQLGEVASEKLISSPVIYGVERKPVEFRHSVDDNTTIVISVVAEEVD